MSFNIVPWDKNISPSFIAPPPSPAIRSVIIALLYSSWFIVLYFYLLLFQMIEHKYSVTTTIHFYEAPNSAVKPRSRLGCPIYTLLPTLYEIRWKQAIQPNKPLRTKQNGKRRRRKKKTAEWGNSLAESHRKEQSAMIFHYNNIFCGRSWYRWYLCLGISDFYLVGIIASNELQSKENGE